MSNDGFTVGSDVSLTLVTPQLGPVTLNLLTGWNKKQLTSTESPKGLDGKVRHVRFFNGWSGGFNVDRTDSTLDDYFALLEDNYFNGVDEKAASITELIQEATGNITQWRYTGVLLTFDDAGNATGDATVKQAVSFMAARRLKIA